MIDLVVVNAREKDACSMLLRSFQLRVATGSPHSSTCIRKKMMHTNQIPLTLATARSMIRNQFPQYRDHEITRLETSTGTVNAIFRIGSDATARFPLQVYHPGHLADVLRGEAAAMTELAEHCPFPTPKPLGLGQPTEHYPLPWAVQSWVEGNLASSQKLAQSYIFALDLVQLIASLRAAPTQGRRFDGHNRGGHLPDHDQWMETCFAKSEDLLDVPRLRCLWTQFRALPSPGPDVMSHKDLTPANLLVERRQIVGVLDGGGFGPADPLWIW